MDSYLVENVLRCNVTSSPSERPVIYRKLSRRPKIKIKKREVTSTFEKANGDQEIHRTGETHNDMQLTGTYFDEEDSKFFNEVEARGLETYIYSAVPGSILHHVPLIRGLGADPTNAVYKGEVASGTTVYYPKWDSPNFFWLEETDFVNKPILARGGLDWYFGIPPFDFGMPLGRGTVVLPEEKNMVKNSLFADDGTNVYNWTYSGANPLNRKDDTGWAGVPSLWLWGAGSTWTSDVFDISSLADGDQMAISFGWRTDYQLRMRFRFVNGAITVDTDKVYQYQNDYVITSIAIPPGIGGLGGTCQIIFELPAGTTRGDICAPQVTLGDTSVGGRRSYTAFLGGSGNNVCGEITAQSLKVTGKWQASGTTGCYNNLCVSGYVKALGRDSRLYPGSRIFCLVDSETGKETECYFDVVGSQLRIVTRAGGVVYNHVDIPWNPHYTYFIALYVGRLISGLRMGVKVRVVGGLGTYAAEDLTALDKFTIYDTLYIGCDENELHQADCIFQDVNIWTGGVDNLGQYPVDTMVEYMANPANLMEHRETVGRLYHLQPNLSPNPYNRQKLDGTINCINTRVL